MSGMRHLFGKKKARNTPAPAPSPVPPPVQEVSARTTRRDQDPGRAVVRDTERMTQRAKRDMNRERVRLEAEERKIMSQIKQLGRQNRMGEARMLAKNLVQVRKAKERTFQADARLGSINMQAKMANTDASMLKVMDGATSVMKNVNEIGISGEKAQNVVMNYEMESEKQKLTQEMTDEVMDSVLSGGDVDIDAGTDDVLNSVLDEIGLELSSQGAETPTIKPTMHHAQQTQQQQHMQQMQQRDDNALAERFQGLQ